MQLNWKGKEVEERVVRRLSNALADIGLDIEGEAKKELFKPPGFNKGERHGVVTGTLRRSIHTAGPDYSWTSDNIEPSKSSPERGKQPATPKKEGRRLWITIGSGLVYALAVHQGHGSFGGYHYITNAVKKVKPRVLTHVRRHRND